MGSVRAFTRLVCWLVIKGLCVVCAWSLSVWLQLRHTAIVILSICELVDSDRLPFHATIFSLEVCCSRLGSLSNSFPP